MEQPLCNDCIMNALNIKGKLYNRCVHFFVYDYFYKNETFYHQIKETQIIGLFAYIPYIKRTTDIIGRIMKKYSIKTILGHRTN